MYVFILLGKIILIFYFFVGEEQDTSDTSLVY